MNKFSITLALILNLAVMESLVYAKSSFVSKEDIRIKSFSERNNNSFITLRPYIKVPAEIQNPNGELTSDIIINVLDSPDGFGSDYAPWYWSEEAYEILDSYAPFIFRTKKSTAILEELRVVISIDAVGKVISYKILNNSIDKGLKERVAHVIRKMPNATPVPGFDSYEPMDFELIMGF
jgi:hypothetical protein